MRLLGNAIVLSALFSSSATGSTGIASVDIAASRKFDKTRSLRATHPESLGNDRRLGLKTDKSAKEGESAKKLEKSAEKEKSMSKSTEEEKLEEIIAEVDELGDDIANLEQGTTATTDTTESSTATSTTLTTEQEDESGTTTSATMSTIATATTEIWLQETLTELQHILASAIDAINPESHNANSEQESPALDTRVAFSELSEGTRRRLSGGSGNDDEPFSGKALKRASKSCKDGTKAIERALKSLDKFEAEKIDEKSDGKDVMKKAKDAAKKLDDMDEKVGKCNTDLKHAMGLGGSDGRRWLGSKENEKKKEEEVKKLEAEKEKLEKMKDEIDLVEKDLIGPTIDQVHALEEALMAILGPMAEIRTVIDNEESSSSMEDAADDEKESIRRRMLSIGGHLRASTNA